MDDKDENQAETNKVEEDDTDTKYKDKGTQKSKTQQFSQPEDELIENEKDNINSFESKPQLPKNRANDVSESVLIERVSFIEYTQYLDFDDVLPLIGEFGIFQKFLFLLMIPFCFIAAFIYLGQIFITLPPSNYYCFVHDLHVISSEEARMALSIPKKRDGSYSRCLMYDANYTEIRFSKNRPNVANTSLPQVPCKEGYVFNDRHMPFNSATMEFGWVCENNFYATYAQIIFFMGSITGSLGYGHLADRCGRLTALVSSCFLGLVGSLFTAMAEDFLAFGCARFIVGASYDTCFTMMYILMLEYVGPSHRTFVANMSLAIFYAPFCCLIPWMALWMGNWRKFSSLSAMPIAISLFSYCILPESARWLVSVGRVDEAIKILRRVARQNKQIVMPTLFEHFRHSCQQFYNEELEGRNFTVFSIFRRGRLCRYMILLIVVWMAMSLVYDGHVRTASVLDDRNVLVIFTIACATELPGNLLILLLLDRCGRRWTSFGFMILCGLFSLLAAQMTNLYQMLVTAIAGRFFANICYNIGLQWAAEVLPTVVRAQGVAFIHTTGFVAMLLSPPIIYLSHFSLFLTLTILGSFAIVGGMLTLLLPETLNQDLPQSLSDGDFFGQDQRIWHMPCCGPGSKRQRLPRRVWHQGSSLRTISRDEFRSKKLHRLATTRIRAPPSSRPTSRRASKRVSDNKSQESLVQEQVQHTYDFKDTKAEVNK